jgi:hypothetical protein
MLYLQQNSAMNKLFPLNLKWFNANVGTLAKGDFVFSEGASLEEQQGVRIGKKATMPPRKDGREIFHCGAYPMLVPNITIADVLEMKRLPAEQDAYFKKTNKTED